MPDLEPVQLVPLTREVVTPPPAGVDPKLRVTQMMIAIMVITTSISMLIHDLVRW